MYSVQQRTLVSAYGDFIARWPWDQYATLTFGRSLSPSTCKRHWDEFINSLGRITRGRVGWVRADEARWSGCGQPEVPLHHHALLIYKTPAPKPEAVAALWKAKSGDALVEAYLREGGGSGGGASWYISKLFPYDDANYDLGGLEHFGCSDDRPIRGSVH